MNSSHRIFGFYGYSDSGKTTLIERISHELFLRGLKTVVIKCSKEPSANITGTDTHRYLEAGALVSVFAGQEETGFFINSHMHEKEIIELLAAFGKIDIILVEGSRDPEIPKIRIGEIELRPNTITTYQGDYSQILKLILEDKEQEE